jgi:class 3 adenylate cyclase/tetratricopeptide (TPR) repeat protein
MTSERSLRLVAFLFTDIVGSTELTQTLGDEVAHDVLREHNRILREQVARRHGTEVKAMGDGFMTTFDNVQDGIRCAVDIQQAIDGYNRAHSQQPVLVRIGLNAGEAIQEEADYFGSAVIAAARITAKAEGGQILVSNVVKELAASVPDLRLLDRGRFRLKGFDERWRLFEVVWQEDVPTAAPALMERTPFVGREAERADLRRLLDQVARGQGALVMIGGEPGVGKTRLAEELMAEARQRNMTALIGHCYEMEGAPPYIPYAEILEAAARMFPPEALRETLGDSASEVAKLMPELRRLFPDIPPSPELPPEQERRYLFNGMRDFVARTGRNQPVVYVLDDLHWATDASLLLLQHIAQELHEMPVLIVGTYRDVELDVTRPLARTLEELHRQRLAHRVALRRLPEAGVAAMLRALSDQEPPKPLVDVVYSETEGNPFFVEEVFQHLAEEGKLFDVEGRWRPDLEVSELEVPEGVRLVVGRRLQRAAEECRRILSTAAVIGRSFTFELLEALVEADTDTLLDAIDEAERANLITSAEDGSPDGQAEARFIFAHELIRQTLVSGLSLPRRQRLHLRIADAIEQAHPNHVEEHAADLAHHLYQAGAAAEPDRTIHFLALAGERALEAVAFEDALTQYERALSLQPPDDPRRQADLRYKRGLALRSLGRWDEAMADWREALTAYEELGDAEASVHVCAEIGSQLGWGAHYVEALEITSRGLALLQDHVSVDRSSLLAQAGAFRGLAGDYQAGEDLLDQALTMAEELGDRRQVGGILGAKALIHGWYMQASEALDLNLRAVEGARESGDLWFLSGALVWVQYARLYLGHLDEVGTVGQEADALATRLGNLGALYAIRRGSGARELMITGDIDEFQRFAERDMELCRTTGAAYISNSHSALGLVHFWRGRWEEALEEFQEAAELEPAGMLAGMDWGYLFLARAYVGDRDSALTLLNQKRGDLPHLGRPNAVGTWIMLLAVVEGLAVLGEREEVGTLYPSVLAATETGVIVLWWGRLLQLFGGMAAAAAGKWEQADDHFQTALRQAHELPHKIEQAEVRRWYARMLIDRDAPGDRDKARQLLTEAIAMYGQIGMPKHIEMAEAILREV